MHVTRRMLRVLMLLLLVPSLARVTGATNAQVRLPMPPGTTIRLSSPPEPKAGSKTPVDAQFRLGSNDLAMKGAIEFRILEGKASVADVLVPADDSGHARA
ncbi:MAG: hypothetical protein ACRD2J_14000, partial [Thermoanaerobaculia bacterium]